MHAHSLDAWQHPHDFAVIQKHGEKRTFQVLIITAVTMLFEIAAGMAYGSMALLADGWHMGTHVAAFMITIFAYRFAQKHADSKAFAFGTGKVGVLGGFASAIALIVVALFMLIESGQRILAPQPIHFNEAIGVAALGLLVNIACAFLLQGHHDHGHAHDDDDDDGHHHHHDHNLKAAYLHVLADALTSVLAIGALLFGKYLGWNWLDPLMGIVGALVISRWAYGLVRETGGILLDGSISGQELAAIKEKIEGTLDNRIADMHVWKVGPAHYAAILSIVTHYPQKIDYYKGLLHDFPNLAHLTVEVHPCESEPCLPQ
ncbi:MAG: CDF family Co(II)/Ni(II) efflux transporter DmeF [Proteobacteria bacterium]|jgi:cation diffusion facilitator family transporter|nr:CDF family Co(II)/Ni(II) efflux transporter DmeF [Pseudomonadota bacterium]MCG2822570.1 CDF family Co(II)/Ni(II) efflux transporter DmeF [Desulfobulbaceae bacterium]MDP2001954.1 CDF family Co(II)/Ni(II) efflux transporter DmeF [Desulfurivibrionaceae bacterium]MBU4228988.1 CDF family Co(II)/Ni(II) efflux transporter DmeF [Pseudomonadota bacterium]MBU4408235.1 CDF family Co(II)/Ni(II) efflux transporter DmeF [Pseudomonadota bacterium]